MEQQPVPVKRKGGRPKGSRNKIGSTLKEMILQLAKKDNWKLLKRIAEEEPVAFAALIGKVLPMEIKNDQSVTVYVQGYDIQRPEGIEFKPPKMDAQMREVMEFIDVIPERVDED